MRIDKYKYLKNSKYEVIIDNEKYIMYEDIIIKYDIKKFNIDWCFACC